MFKLITAIEAAAGRRSTAELIDKYADFMCLGTVADISPLIDENRIIVTEGLKRFKNTKIITVH